MIRSEQYFAAIFTRKEKHASFFNQLFSLPVVVADERMIITSNRNSVKGYIWQAETAKSSIRAKGHTVVRLNAFLRSVINTRSSSSLGNGNQGGTKPNWDLNAR